MTAIGPYVVVFWTLSRLVLVRKDCDAAFLLYSQSNMVEQVVTCSCVHWSPCLQALCRVQLTSLFDIFWVQSCHSSWTLVWKLSPAGVVTRWFGHPGARDRFFNHVRLGIKEERCIAAFSNLNHSTQRPKDYNIWAMASNRGHLRVVIFVLLRGVIFGVLGLSTRKPSAKKLQKMVVVWSFGVIFVSSRS